jgi:hypothetical protein
MILCGAERPLWDAFFQAVDVLIERGDSTFPNYVEIQPSISTNSLGIGDDQQLQ